MSEVRPSAVPGASTPLGGAPLHAPAAGVAGVPVPGVPAAVVPPGAASVPPPAMTRGPRETRVAWCLAWGLAAALSVLELYHLFVQDPRGLLIDHAAFTGAGLGRAGVEPIATLVLGIVSVQFLLIAMTVAVVFAALRRRWGDAARALVVAGGANVTSQILKAALERPDTAALTEYSLGNSLPSGHTTVAASVVAMALLVVPRAVRAWAALIGAGYVAATGVATMSLAWHRPSDVVAAIAVVSAWSLLVLVPAQTRAPAGARPSPVRTGIAWLLGLVAGTGLAIALATVRRTLELAGTDLTSASAALDVGATRVMFLGSAFGVVGAAALACWAVLLARR